jgi:ribonuclease J
MKKTRLPFSSLSIEEDKKPKTHAHTNENHLGAGEHKHPAHSSAQKTKSKEKSRSSKSSTYQYSKGGRGGGRQPQSQHKKPIEGKIPPPVDGNIRVIPLGGVEEVGRNMILIESENDIIVLDVGFHFIDEEEAMGADFTLPNFKYLEERKEKIRAVAITHGHLDHIGGIPFIMDRIGNPPIYAQNLTILMIKKRQEEFVGKPPLTLHVVDESTKIKFNELSLGFFPVYHSIPDSMGVKVGTPYGNIIVSGDMKLEHDGGKPTPKEEKKWTGLGKENTLMLVADSTNAEVPGYSISEKEVQKNIEEIIRTISHY